MFFLGGGEDGARERKREGEGKKVREKRESRVREVGNGGGRRKSRRGRKKEKKLSHHRVQQPVLRLHLAVDARGHRPEGPDALAQGVDAPVVFPLEGLWVDLY